MTENRLKSNTLLCRVMALLFLIMMVRYRAIFVLLTDTSSNIYSIIVVALFYLLNIVSTIGLFIPRQWGFIVCYFSIPLSTYLFATSYFSFITDWIAHPVLIYLIPFLNAFLLIGIITLQVKRYR